MVFGVCVCAVATATAVSRVFKFADVFVAACESDELLALLLTRMQIGTASTHEGHLCPPCEATRRESEELIG
eukprot:1645616-Amphidinium_carterae.1